MPRSGSRTWNRANVLQYLSTYNQVSGITFYHPNVNLILVSCALEDSLWGATLSRLLSESDSQGSNLHRPAPNVSH